MTTYTIATDNAFLMQCLIPLVECISDADYPVDDDALNCLRRILYMLHKSIEADETSVNLFASAVSDYVRHLQFSTKQEPPQ